ncbi:MAG: IS66 family transposase [[Clostridium] innocuum]
MCHKSKSKVLLNYLEDGETEISNNRAVRMVKPFVMVRKA